MIFFLSESSLLFESTLIFRPLAGSFSSTSMSKQTIIVMGAPFSRLINYDTQKDVVYHTTIFYIPHGQRILAPIAGLFSRLFERLSSIRRFPVETEEDACFLSFRLRSFSTTDLRLQSPVFFASRHTNVEQYKSILSNKTHVFSTEGTLLS